MNNSELARIFALYSKRDVKEGDWITVNDGVQNEYKELATRLLLENLEADIKLIPTELDLLNVMTKNSIDVKIRKVKISLIKNNTYDAGYRYIYDERFDDLSKAIGEAFLYLHNNKHLEVLK